MKILFMCVANSARSQLAHGLANDIFKGIAEVESAGSQPSKVNSFAIQAMKEIGLDISSHYSKSVGDLKPEFIQGLDYVITLCAEEVCPVIISKAKKLHWPMPDPAGHGEISQEDRLKIFRNTRDVIKAKLILFKNETIK